MKHFPERPFVWVALNWWVDEIFAGIADYAEARGWIVDARMRWSRGAVPDLPRKPDGVIVFAGENEELRRRVRELRVPVVDMETYADHFAAPKVTGDDRAIGHMAARHLAGCQPRKLVYTRPEGPILDILKSRIQGFRAGAAEANLPCVETTPESFDPREAAKEGPVGVFTGGDMAALDLLYRCLAAGVRVPEDIAILGADDTPYVCQLAPVPLSSVNMAFEEKGRRAAMLLERLMRGEKPVHAPVVVPPAGVTLRESTTVVRTGHADLDRLVRHFRENAHRPVKVDELCAACGVPMRTAQHLAKVHLGSNPMALLNGFRLRIAERLDGNPQLTKDGVAKSAGFSGRAALLRAQRAEKTGRPKKKKKEE